MKKLFAIFALLFSLSIASVSARASGKMGYVPDYMRISKIEGKWYVGANFSQGWANYVRADNSIKGAVDLQGEVIIGYSFRQTNRPTSARIEIAGGVGQYYGNGLMGQILMRIYDTYYVGNNVYLGPVFEVGGVLSDKTGALVFSAGFMSGYFIGDHFMISGEIKVTTLDVIAGGSIGTAIGVRYFF